MSKIWAIGDIHGCYNEMVKLVHKCMQNGMNPVEDTVVFLGDYIDRGPDSAKVINQLIKWKKKYPHWVFIYGNHEDLFRDWIYGARQYGEGIWLGNGGNTTWESYGGNFGRMDNDEFEAPKRPEFLQEHLDFLFKETVYFYETEDYFFVHGGVLPGEALNKSKNYPRTLLWARYGFIDSDYDWGKKIIFGHTPDNRGDYYNPDNPWGKKQVFKPIVKKNKIGIDTACCPPANQRLTAIKLPDELFFFIESNNKS